MLPDSKDTLTLSIYWRGEDTSPSSTVNLATILGNITAEFTFLLAE